MNKTHKTIISICLVFIGSLSFCASQNSPFYLYPLDSIYGISGNFGDIRSHHFHSGIDFRTLQREGLPVYAVDSGYVSRIFVSPLGFGKALYLRHKNGYTTVYAHLMAFNENISSFVKNIQYKKESFSIDILLKENEIPVSACDLIGYSGNSGSSEGPHLHFETRQSKTEKPVHPALLGLGMPDTVPPVFEFVRIYPSGDIKSIHRQDKHLTYKVVKKKDGFALDETYPVILPPVFSLGICGYDQINNSRTKFDLYSFKIFIDTSLVFSASADSFAFSDTRYVNTYIDYKEHVTNKRDFFRTYISPNNGLGFYHIKTNHGMFYPDTANEHSLRIIIADVFRNESHLDIRFRADKKLKTKTIKEVQPVSKICFPQKKNIITTPSFLLEIPKNALFDTAYISCHESRKADSKYSIHCTVGDSYIPLFKRINLSIKPFYLPERLRNKAVIMKVEKNGAVYAGGEWDNGFVKSSVFSFGTYRVSVDTVPPEIRCHSDLKKIYHEKDTILVQIYDLISGINTYRPLLNGKWIAMDYDAKNSLITYTVDEQALPGYNNVCIEVTDKKGNRSVVDFDFIRK